MQFTTLLMAFGLSSVALGAAVDSRVEGVAIHVDGAPVATSLSISQTVAEVEKRDLGRRATGHLFVCTDSNFNGACQNLQFTTGVCMNLFSPFQDSISSLGPDNGFTCTVWQDANCSGTSIGGIINPGIFDLNNFSPNLNDKISSYRCN